MAKAEPNDYYAHLYGLTTDERRYILVKNGRYPFSENGDIRSLLSVQN